LKTTVTTLVCDMAHREETPAQQTVTFELAGPATRVPRIIDLCNACAKKYLEPMFFNARSLPREVNRFQRR
jgi:hypothetical protein